MPASDGGQFARIAAGVVSAVGDEDGGFERLRRAVQRDLLQGRAELRRRRQCGRPLRVLPFERRRAQRHDLLAEFVADHGRLLADILQPVLLAAARNASTLSNLESLDSAAASHRSRFTSGSSKAFAHWSVARSICATALDKIARHSGNQRSRSSEPESCPD